MVAVQRDPLRLQRGGFYRARVRLSGFAECHLATAGMVAARFQELGFSDVNIYDDVEALPADWPPDQREFFCDLSAGQCCRWAEGVWQGDDTTIKAPPQVVALWLSRPPVSPEPPPDQPAPEPPPPADPLSGRSCNVSSANAVLRAAWRKEFGDAKFPAATRQILLSIGKFEGGWGCAPFRSVSGAKVANKNNWGAIHCPAAKGGGQITNPPAGALWTGCVSASDTEDLTDATRFPVAFRAYSTSLDGCRDMIRILRSVLPTMATGDADAVAKKMKKVYRYGAPISHYATAILDNAKGNARALNEKLHVHSGRQRKEDAWPWVAAAAGVLLTAGGLGTYRYVQGEWPWG